MASLSSKLHTQHLNSITPNSEDVNTKSIFISYSLGRFWQAYILSSFWEDNPILTDKQEQALFLIIGCNRTNKLAAEELNISEAAISERRWSGIVRLINAYRLVIDRYNEDLYNLPETFLVTPKQLELLEKYYGLKNAEQRQTYQQLAKFSDLTPSEISMACQTAIERLVATYFQGKAIALIHSKPDKTTKSSTNLALELSYHVYDEQSNTSLVAWHYKRGNEYYNQGEYEKAKYYFEEALFIYPSFSNNNSQQSEDFRGSIHRDLSRTLRNLGQYEYAYLEINKAINVHRASNKPDELAQSYYQQGLILSEIGRFQDAIQAQRKAMNYAESANSDRIKGDVYVGLGNALYGTKQIDAAKCEYEKALALGLKLKNRKLEGISLGRLGIVYTSLLQYELAVKYLLDSISIAQEVEDLRGESFRKIHLGIALMSQKNYEEAIECVSSALQIAQRIQHKANQILALRVLGDTNYLMGEIGKASEYYRQNLRLFEKDANFISNIY